jgi:TP53 regulating kinase-like protein
MGTPDMDESDWELISQGAEAKLWSLSLGGRPAVVKERFQKAYRHPDLDSKLTRRRVLAEARSLSKCRKAGIDTPTLFLVDLEKNRLFMEKVNGTTVKAELNKLYKLNEDTAIGYGAEGNALACAIGAAIAKMHNCGIIHGDLTTSNMFIRRQIEDETSVVLIDFGLSYGSNSMHEDKAVDLYVMERAFTSTHANSQHIIDEVLRVYKAKATRSDAIMQKLASVRQRGRKRECFG